MKRIRCKYTLQRYKKDNSIIFEEFSDNELSCLQFFIQNNNDVIIKKYKIFKYQVGKINYVYKNGLSPFELKEILEKKYRKVDK